MLNMDSTMRMNRSVTFPAFRALQHVVSDNLDGMDWILRVYTFICLKGRKQGMFSLPLLDSLPPDGLQVLDICCKLSLFKLLLWRVSPVSNRTHHCASGVAAGGFCFPL